MNHEFYLALRQKFLLIILTVSSTGLVFLRSVAECQPQIRLNRLLNRSQFDEAELFAKKFKLDLQVNIYFSIYLFIIHYTYNSIVIIYKKNQLSCFLGNS